MIRPTVGRIVYFYAKLDIDPMPAIITAVWGDDCINAVIFDYNGRPLPNPPTSITLVQPGEEKPDNSPFCEWMPYQTSGSRS